MITAIGVSYPSKRERVLGAEFAMMLKAMIPYKVVSVICHRPEKGRPAPYWGGKSDCFVLITPESVCSPTISS